MSEYPWNKKNNIFTWLSSLSNPFKEFEHLFLKTKKYGLGNVSEYTCMYQVFQKKCRQNSNHLNSCPKRSTSTKTYWIVI